MPDLINPCPSEPFIFIYVYNMLMSSSSGYCKMEQTCFGNLQSIIVSFVSFIREDPIDLESGAQHIMRYRAIAPLLSNGSVALL